ncbi:hypothetical protein RND71_024895 [Anisodus tanguticus]|uniref:Trehalose 6-phosphate phosphatase n=1 Tax=Anisodus tanguticus TaxID=243964 RepID=A0AAE1RRG6_9SOLA|nr:hypothetical protein RND71_024895 [Anisodus tanguticus]
MIPRKKPGRLDDVRSNGWLDAMKSSSPPSKKVQKEQAPRIFLMMLKTMMGLSPIVDDPDRAFISADMRSAVRDVAKHFPTAIISGRSRDKVYQLVGLTELYYAGSHGMDIMLPIRNELCTNGSLNKSLISSFNLHFKQGKEVNLFQTAREFLPMIDESWSVLAQCVHDVLREYPRLRQTHGRKVLEVRPVIEWDEGKAVEFFLESLGMLLMIYFELILSSSSLFTGTKEGFKNSHDVLPIYIGDDRIDEDAFKVLRGRYQGYGILVSAIPKESNAIFSLSDTSEVKEFLISLAKTMEIQEI